MGKRQIASRTKKPSQDSGEWPVYIVVDIGNKLIKVLLISPNARGNWPSVVYPHALKDITEVRFRQLAQRYSNAHPGEISDMFGYTFREVYADKTWELRTRYVIVGEEASSQGVLDRRSGSLKYQREYYAPLLIPGLQKLLPHGHDNIHLMAMYPPGDIDYLDDLKIAIGGKHRVVTADGREIQYKIRSVRAVDEPVGGLMHRIVGVDGQTYADHGLSGRRILVIDIGGQVSSMVPATKEGHINYAAAQSFQLGIYDVLQDFEREIRRTYPEFRKNRNPSEEQMREALDTGYWHGGGGDPLDCSEAKEQAIARIMNQIINIYENEMGGSLSYDHVLITGGGGALLEGMMRMHLGHQSISRAEHNRDEMHLANVRGAAKMFINELSKSKEWTSAR